MYRDLSWSMFEKTGSIDQYLLYKELQQTDKSDEYGIYKNNGGSSQKENH
ncbi:MAG: YqzL family protein [Ruminococcaceae bacterium]|nr:YqzL family protein [Oscillospiraceae bacterium]